MVNMFPHGKDISVMHLNADWGYIAYIECTVNSKGEPTYQVVRVSLGNGYKPQGEDSQIDDSFA
jgi:hypothetical protein